MNIALFRGKSIFKYEEANYYVDEFAKQFEKSGHSVTIIDIDKLEREKKENALEEIFKNVAQGKEEITIEDYVKEIFEKNQIELVLSVNGINMVPIDIYEDLDIVLGIILTEHPFKYINEIEKYRSYVTFVTMIDEEMLNTFNKYIDNFVSVSWLMNGGSQYETNYDKEFDIVIYDNLEDDENSIKKLDEFEENYFKELSNILYKLSNEEKLKKSLEEIVKELLFGGIKNNDYYKNTLDSYLDKIVSDSRLPEVTKKSTEYRKKIAKIYNYVNNRNLENNIKNTIINLLESGLKVHYFGRNKLEEFDKYNNFINHGEVPYKDVIKNVCKSKILLSNLPYYKNGSNALINTAMLNNTLVVSNINNYCNNIYKDKENIVFFDVSNLNNISEKINFYLDNKCEYDNIVNNAYEITSKYNTWKNRTDEIIQIYEVMKENI